MFEEIGKLKAAPATLIVNCAGIIGLPTPFLDTSEECFSRIIDVNLKVIL